MSMRLSLLLLLLLLHENLHHHRRIELESPRSSSSVRWREAAGRGEGRLLRVWKHPTAGEVLMRRREELRRRGLVLLVGEGRKVGRDVVVVVVVVAVVVPVGGEGE
jgi:hypothetical protein